MLFTCLPGRTAKHGYKTQSCLCLRCTHPCKQIFKNINNCAWFYKSLHLKKNYSTDPPVHCPFLQMNEPTLQESPAVPLCFHPPFPAALSSVLCPLSVLIVRERIHSMLRSVRAPAQVLIGSASVFQQQSLCCFLYPVVVEFIIP